MKTATSVVVPSKRSINESDDPKETPPNKKPVREAPFELVPENESEINQIR